VLVEHHQHVVLHLAIALQRLLGADARGAHFIELALYLREALVERVETALVLHAIGEEEHRVRQQDHRQDDQQDAFFPPDHRGASDSGTPPDIGGCTYWTVSENE
jgi:hypothetical protein